MTPTTAYHVFRDAVRDAGESGFPESELHNILSIAYAADAAKRRAEQREAEAKAEAALKSAQGRAKIIGATYGPGKGQIQFVYDDARVGTTPLDLEILIHPDLPENARAFLIEFMDNVFSGRNEAAEPAPEEKIDVDELIKNIAEAVAEGEGVPHILHDITMIVMDEDAVLRMAHRTAKELASMFPSIFKNGEPTKPVEKHGGCTCKDCKCDEVKGGCGE